MMMWMWISAIAILLGAQLNAEIEHQTARDLTVGPDKPLGRRGAMMADTIGAAQELRLRAGGRGLRRSSRSYIPSSNRKRHRVPPSVRPPPHMISAHFLRVPKWSEGELARRICALPRQFVRVSSRQGLKPKVSNQGRTPHAEPPPLASGERRDRVRSALQSRFRPGPTGLFRSCSCMATANLAATWQTQIWRFESNGYPRDRLFAISFTDPAGARRRHRRPTQPLFDARTSCASSRRSSTA